MIWKGLETRHDDGLFSEMMKFGILKLLATKAKKNERKKEGRGKKKRYINGFSC